MKNKNIWLLTIFSLLACVLHAIMLRSPFNYYVYTSIIKIILFILCPIIYFKVSKDGEIKDLLIMKGDKKNIKLSFIFGLFVFAFILVVYIILRPYLDNTMIVAALGHNGITSRNFSLVFIYIVLINAVLEELFFRGFTFMTLYRMDSKRYAHVYSCLLFAFYHIAILNNAVSLGVYIFLIVGLAVSGLIFNHLVIKCKSIFGGLIVHISANLALNLIVCLYLFSLEIN